MSEVLGMQAVDEDGRALGEVHDVRLREEAVEGNTGRRFVVDGLVIGVGALRARLGYAHGDMAGPWLLAWLLRRLARRARYVPWASVRSLDGERLVVGAAVETLVRPAARGGEEP